ncbi:MAG: NUDIX hydrolase [Cyanobacteriota bacterium]|nr:NUDIX hydrolase [Cyanobacteriota bacterium]
MTQLIYTVAKAFIYQGDRLLLQLRDDNPHITYPNTWALFGGMVEPEETPEQAIRRELEEELTWIPPDVQFLSIWEERETLATIHVFSVPLTVPVNQLHLTEGQALKLFALDELTKFPVVPKILRMLPQAIAAIASPELTAAWQLHCSSSPSQP